MPAPAPKAPAIDSAIVAKSDLALVNVHVIPMETDALISPEKQRAVAVAQRHGDLEIRQRFPR